VVSPRRIMGPLLLVGLNAVALTAQTGKPILSRPLPLLSRRVDPKEFGTQDDTITVIAGVAFKGDRTGFGLGDGFALYAPLNQDSHFYASLNLPAGAVIDTIGVNTATDTDSITGIALWERYDSGDLALLTGFSSPAHDWDTDFTAPLGITVSNHVGDALILELEVAPSPTYEYFGYVEVHWHRTVSPPPANASFADVPTSHPFFQYIDAIHAAGITAGCGGGNFCPDQAITRKQEAAFLSKALGLHWPD
jgi:S-layer family protein